MSVRSGYGTVARRLRTLCEACGLACGGPLDQAEYYSCLLCNNLILCIDCVAQGALCEDERHPWTEHGFDIDGDFVVRERKIRARIIHRAQFSYPSLFRPWSSTATPESLFAKEHRFISNEDPRKILVYADGACSDNGQSNARGGYGVVHRPTAYDRFGKITHPGYYSGRLENRGPYGQRCLATSNRAELRGAISALMWRDWSTDCLGVWTSLVIATDSEYVALGATEWIRRWDCGGWKTLNRNTGRYENVKNQDLWQRLLDETRVLEARGVSVSFWRIPSEWNKTADTLAKAGIYLVSREHFGS